VETNNRKDALIGVGMTGIASNKCKDLDLTEAAEVVKEENKRIAAAIGINPAARTTTVKPSGTSSLVLGCSSGIHAWHNDYYIRRIRVGKNESIYPYLADKHPELVEDEYFRPTEQAVISIPQKAPEGALYRTENVVDFLERVKRWNTEWVRPGHIDGQNAHNVSATVSIKEDEWEKVGEWMWENRETFNGLSVLPYFGGSYQQAPFEDTDKETYDRMFESLKNVDLTKIIEMTDETDLSGELACVGGSCEITEV
jgi:ribonucleoside-triphosphate reductase (thioredoxin)